MLVGVPKMEVIEWVGYSPQHFIGNFKDIDVNYIFLGMLQLLRQGSPFLRTLLNSKVLTPEPPSL